MSVARITVAQLIERLRELPQDLPVGTLAPVDRTEASIEGCIEGADLIDVVEAWEVRTGWIYPLPEHADKDFAEKVVVISGEGIQWLEAEAELEGR